MKIKWIKLFLVVVCFLYLIVLLVKNLSVRSEAMRSLESLEAEVKTTGRERVKLQQEIDGANTQEFIEEQARDTLNMVKEGETVLIMPDDVPAVVENKE